MRLSFVLEQFSSWKMCYSSGVFQAFSLSTVSVPYVWLPQTCTEKMGTQFTCSALEIWLDSPRPVLSGRKICVTITRGCEFFSPWRNRTLQMQWGGDFNCGAHSDRAVSLPWGEHVLVWLCGFEWWSLQVFSSLWSWARPWLRAAGVSRNDQCIRFEIG